ncbi:MAG: hypothetical protein KAI67_04950 [Candidatus Pacebacteria bacterium]|nr:hypothetical protein [Candidatus Paceibacterota bacterium]
MINKEWIPVEKPPLKKMRDIGEDTENNTESVKFPPEYNKDCLSFGQAGKFALA